MINNIAVFVFYCMMTYIGFVVLWALYGAMKAIFVPSSRTYSRSGLRRSSSNNDDFYPIFWDDSQHCDHSHPDHCGDNHGD